MKLFFESIDRWIALRTSARWEKKIATMLEIADVPVFLPTMTRLVRYRGKNRKSEIPLFSGYVFCSEIDFRDKAISSICRKQIAQILRPATPKSLYDELLRLGNLLKSHELIQEMVLGSVGSKVRIIGGALAGYEGSIIKVNPNQSILILELSLINTRIEVQIEQNMVEKITANK